MTRAVVLTKADRSIPSPAIEANTGYLDNGVWYTMAGTASEPPWADDVVSMDEIDDDQVDQVADSYDADEDQWIGPLLFVVTAVPENLPNYDAARVAFANWVENPTKGGATAEFIAETAAWSDDSYKGVCFARAGHVPEWITPAYDSLTEQQWIDLAAANGCTVTPQGSKAATHAAIVAADYDGTTNPVVTGDNTAEKEGVLALVRTYVAEHGWGL